MIWGSICFQTVTGKRLNPATAIFAKSIIKLKPGFTSSLNNLTYASYARTELLTYNAIVFMTITLVFFLYARV